MQIRFDTIDGEGILSIDNENITLLMEKKDTIYKKISEQLEEGFMELKDFKTKGVPGKIKYNRKYKYIEDLLVLLRGLRKEYKVYNIVVVKSFENKDYKIIEIDELIVKGIINNESHIREFEDRYEYCIIKEYENIYDDFRVDIVQFNEVFIKFINLKDEKIIASINFPKKNFDISKIGNWIIYNKIKSFNNNVSHVKNASKIFEGIKFKDSIILLYSKGNRDLPIDKSQLIEIDSMLFLQTDKINIFHSDKLISNKTDMNIILDGKKINYIPEKELYSSKGDILICCNGLIINASYIGNYNNSIGFFKDKSSKEPIAWIFDTEEVIQIDTRYDFGGDIVFLEYNVNFSITDFF